jgi:hypothetical protein
MIQAVLKTNPLLFCWSWDVEFATAYFDSLSGWKESPCENKHDIVDTLVLALFFKTQT